MKFNDSSELTEVQVKQDDHSVCWKVDNKYYSADITIQRLSANSVEDSDCEAVVFLCAWNEVSRKMDQN